MEQQDALTKFVRATVWIGGIASIAALLFQLYLMHYGRDQAIYSVVARTMLDGGAPYKDAWDFKPPGIYFVYALARSLFGESVHAIRIFEALAMLSGIGAFAILSKRFLGAWTAAIVAGFIMLVSHVGLGFWETAQPEAFGGIAVVWALVLATTSTSNPQFRPFSPPWLAWAGCAALFTLASLMKPPLGGGIAFAFAALCWKQWSARPRAERARRVISVVTAFFVGTMIVIVPCFGYLIAKGAWPEFRYIFFEYVPQYTAISFSWEQFPSLIVETFGTWPTAFPFFFGIGILFALLLPKVHREERIVFFLIGGCAATQLLGIALQAKLFVYHYAGLFPLLGLTVSWGFFKLARIWKPSWTMLALLLFAAHDLSQRTPLLTASAQRLEAWNHPEKALQINDRIHSAFDVNAGANRKIAEWIAKHTPPELPIYVWGFEPGIYEMAQRRASSKYIYNAPQRSAWGTKRARMALMEDLLRAPPSAIVTLAQDQMIVVTQNRLDSAAAIETFPNFAAFLDGGYEKVGTAEDLTLFKRKDLLSPQDQKLAFSTLEGVSQAEKALRPTPADKRDRRHVLLLTVDTLRTDYLSSNGYELLTTPALDALFDRSTVFSRAVTPSPRTTPALASLLTGRYPHQTGVRRLLDRLADDATSLAELASQNDFDTLAIVSNHILTEDRGLGRGFDLYDSAGDARSAADTTASAKQALAGKSATDSIFVWVHYIDPHAPYLPKRETVDKLLPSYDGRYRYRFGQTQGGVGNAAYPKELPKRRAVFQNSLPKAVNERVRQLYAADIRDTDDAIADLLAWLRENFGDDWTIVFTSDHGESLGEHDFYYDHGDYVFNATTRVPLAIATPRGSTDGETRRIKDWVSLVDVAPTLIELLGWEVSEQVASRFEGRSLTPYLRGEPMEPHAVFAESGTSYFPDLIRRRVRFDIEGRFRAVWKDKWKLIWTPFASADEEFQLYNTKKDPNEKRDLVERYPKKVSELRAELAAWMKRQSEMDTGHKASPEELEALRSLGYIE